jgi:hypothetical protein
MFLYGIFIWSLTPQMVADNKRHKAEDFGPTITFVENYKREFGALPTEAQFNKWKIDTDQENRALFLQTTGSLKAEDCPFGSVPQGAYGISVWRGEWFECYASWRDEYSFGDAKATNFKAMLVFFSIGAILFALSLATPRLGRYLTTQSR